MNKFQDYQKEKNYLPVDMTPDELCSIRTFEEDPSQEKFEEPDPVETKKRKRSKSELGGVEEEEKDANNQEEVKEADEEESKSIKKLKANGDNTEVISEVETSMDEGKGGKVNHIFD